jgi:diguanylate cyclase (GGDEF)-like protein
LAILPFVQIQGRPETFDQRPLHILDAVLEDNEAVLQMLYHPVGQAIFTIAGEAVVGHVLLGFSRAARDSSQSKEQQLEATEISVPGDSLSPAALAWSSSKNGIVLPSSHRAFQASFALLDFSAVDGVQYSYKLDGFDKDWISSPTFRRTAAYTNLPAGRYRLLIRASSHFDDGLSAHLEIPVVALAAWYESTWLLLLKIIAGILAIFLVVRLRTAVIRRRQAELETEVAIRTAELAGKQEELLEANDKLVEANEKLAELASRDPLTGIFNRRQFLALAEDAIDSVRRTGDIFTLLLIDADHFKLINDRYGHLAGDEILKSLVGRLSSQLRKTDLIARYGGEELVVPLTNTELHDGLELAERLRAHVANSTMRFGKHDIQVTISIGVTEATGQESVVELVKRADGALYAAKHGGRDRVVCQTTDRPKRNMAID